MHLKLVPGLKKLLHIDLAISENLRYLSTVGNQVTAISTKAVECRACKFRRQDMSIWGDVVFPIEHLDEKNRQMEALNLIGLHRSRIVVREDRARER